MAPARPPHQAPARRGGERGGPDTRRADGFPSRVRIRGDPARHDRLLARSGHPGPALRPLPGGSDPGHAGPERAGVADGRGGRLLRGQLRHGTHDGRVPGAVDDPVRAHRGSAPTAGPRCRRHPPGGHAAVLSDPDRRAHRRDPGRTPAPTAHRSMGLPARTAGSDRAHHGPLPRLGDPNRRRAGRLGAHPRPGRDALAHRPGDVVGLAMSFLIILVFLRGALS